MSPLGLRPARILVVGDVMLDRYYFGEVDRVSPEAPVPVVRFTRLEDFPGGAGNVANNLARLGCEAVLLGFVGRDGEGARLTALLEESHVRCHLVSGNGPTTVKARIVGGHRQVARLDFEPDGREEEDAEREILRGISAHLPSAVLVVLSDYAKGVCTERVSRAVVEGARTYGKPLLVAPKGRTWQVCAGAALAVPNLKELGEVLGSPVANEDSAVEEACRRARKMFGFEALLATRGERGMTLVEDETAVHLPARERKVFDVTGAGDVVVAALAAALASGFSLTDAARLANRAAGLAVGKPGTSPISLAELETAAGVGSRKRIDREDLLRERAIWTKEGKTVVFTNGCFDLLHRGHVSLLERAKALGDVLVVGVNDDASVARLKGKDRPLHSQEDRLAVLEALACVDFVVLFDEDTPGRLVRALAPDVLAKGGDYLPEEVVGRESAGKTVVLPLVEGHSSSRLVSLLSKQE